MKALNILYLVALLLVIVGALNWGLVAIDPEYNVVENTVGKDNAAIVYYIVAASALLVAFGNWKHFKSMF